MKRLVILLVALIGAYLAYTQSDTGVVSPERYSAATQPDAGTQILARAFREQRSNLQVEVSATVSRLLEDDHDSSRHQRFIIALPDGQTVLVAHNIDLAKRVHDLQVGDPVTVFGEYEWSAQGGVLHWTHRDPGAKHIAGWIKHRERIYE